MKTIAHLTLAVGMTTSILQLPATAKTGQPAIEVRTKQVIEADGLRFRDANGNGTLEPYEDWRLPAETRAMNLLQRMSLMQKAGLLLIDTLNAGCRGTTEGTRTADYLSTQHMRRFIIRNTVIAGPSTCEGDPGRSGYDVTPQEMAEFTNAVQAMAEAEPLGIPALFKSNARNHFNSDPRFGISGGAGVMSAFPKEPGIAAAVLGTDSLEPARKLASVMAREWRALGIRGMYGYMGDLATEPRWYRTDETFGEDSATTARILTSLIEGLQGKSLSADSAVALTIKHFPGGGPQQDGLDPHYSFGKNQSYPGGAFAAHVAPFKAAIDAGVSSIMPYYGIPDDANWEGEPFEKLGMSFSSQMIDGFLRARLGFTGNVNSDTGIINDRGWGLEQMTPGERFAAAVNAGVDVLSGFHEAAPVAEQVEKEAITKERLDEAAGRLLIESFRLGLFENPYTKAEAADETVGSKAARADAQEVQKQSVVLLKNDGALPLKQDARVYAIGMAPEPLQQAGLSVTDGNGEIRESAADHDAALIRISVRNVNTRAYRSNDPAYGADPQRLNPRTGKVWGAEDPCNLNPAVKVCVDDSEVAPGVRLGLLFGGALPWEVNDISFSAMAKAQSWEITPSLETIRSVMAEVGADKTVLIINFRQPYVIDAESGLRDAGALLATFEVSGEALAEVLTGAFQPVGRLPFSLAATQQAVISNAPDLPGYSPEDTLYPFGFGLGYDGGK